MMISWVQVDWIHWLLIWVRLKRKIKIIVRKYIFPGLRIFSKTNPSRSWFMKTQLLEIDWVRWWPILIRELINLKTWLFRILDHSKRVDLEKGFMLMMFSMNQKRPQIWGWRKVKIWGKGCIVKKGKWWEDHQVKITNLGHLIIWVFFWDKSKSQNVKKSWKEFVLIHIVMVLVN